MADKIIASRDLIGITFGSAQGAIKQSALLWFLPWMYSAKCGRRARTFGTVMFHIVD